MTKDRLNTAVNKITFILVRFSGIGAFIWQTIQYFTGRWGDEWYKEVSMLVIFFIFARYPKEILNIFKRKTQ